MSDFARSFVINYMRRWHPGVAYHLSDAMLFSVSHLRHKLPLRIQCSDFDRADHGTWEREMGNAIGAYLEPEPDPWQLWSLGP